MSSETIKIKQPKAKTPISRYCSNCHQLYGPNTEQCSFCLTPLPLIQGFKLSDGKFISVEYVKKVNDIVTKYLDASPGLHFYSSIYSSLKRKISAIDNLNSFDEVMVLLSSFRETTIQRRNDYYGTKDSTTVSGKIQQS